VANREEVRGRILEVARRVFFAEGFAAANLDEVARLTGIAKGTIYRYFESKAELYVEVLAQNSDQFVARMRSVLDPELGPAEQIRALGRFYLRHYSENPEYFRIFWALENQRLIGELPKGLVDQVVELWRRCLEVLAAVIERGVSTGRFRPCDPWETANVLWVVANGIIQTEFDPRRRVLRQAPLAKTFEDAVEILLRGLEPIEPD
jgi:TetR/AcrR family fatty acid metabolism transcriptional regulator